DLTNSTNPDGHARFSSVPSGQYLLEVTSPGYGTVREQVGINTSGQVQDILVAMIPEGAVALSRAPSAASVAPRAIKETEKGLHALQIGKLDETQAHLARALA